MDGLVPHSCSITDDEKIRVFNALHNQEQLYDNTQTPHCYFLVDKFEQVENFVKTKKYALFGRKKFYQSIHYYLAILFFIGFNYLINFPYILNAF